MFRDKQSLRDCDSWARFALSISCNTRGRLLTRLGRHYKFALLMRLRPPSPHWVPAKAVPAFVGKRPPPEVPRNEGFGDAPGIPEDVWPIIEHRQGLARPAASNCRGRAILNRMHCLKSSGMVSVAHSMLKFSSASREPALLAGAANRTHHATGLGYRPAGHEAGRALGRGAVRQGASL